MPLKMAHSRTDTAQQTHPPQVPGVVELRSSLPSTVALKRRLNVRDNVALEAPRRSVRLRQKARRNDEARSRSNLRLLVKRQQ